MKKQILFFLGAGFFLSVVAMFPVSSSAALGAPFGGFDTVMIPCTCEGGALSWQLFAPLYFSRVPTGGALIAPPAVGFATYYVRPSTWVLGTYVPGTGAACFVGVEPYCYSMPALGVISPETGVSPL